MTLERSRRNTHAAKLMHSSGVSLVGSMVTSGGEISAPAIGVAGRECVLIAQGFPQSCALTVSPQWTGHIFEARDDRNSNDRGMTATG